MSTKTKAARMKRHRLKEKDKIAFEKQLVKEGKIYPRAHYLPRGRFRSVLACCLAFFFGIFAGLGALIGTGAYFGLTRKTKDILSALNLPGEQYLQEAYLNMTALEIVDSVMKDLGAFNGFGGLSLNVFAKYTPIIGDAIADITSQLKTSLGVELDNEELMSQTFDTVLTYLTEEVKAVPLGKVFTALGQRVDSGDYGAPGAEPSEGAESTADEVPAEGEESGGQETPETPSESTSGPDMHALLLVICYGEAGVDYAVDENGNPVYDENGDVQMLGDSMPTTLGQLFDGGLTNILDKVQSLRLNELITVDESSSPLMQKLGGMKISEITQEETIRGIKISDIITVDPEESGLLNAIADFTIGDLNKPSKIERLRLSDIMNIGDSSSRIMQAMGDWRIGDLTSQSKINSLTLSDVMEIDMEKGGILASIGDTPIGSLQSAIGTLSLGEILGDSADLQSNKILRHLLSSTLDTLSYDVGALTVGQVFGEQIYSYMKNEKVDGVTHDYAFLYSQYFGKQAGKPDSYNYELPEFNQKRAKKGGGYEDDTTLPLYRPKAVGEAEKAAIVTAYLTKEGTPAVKGYFIKNADGSYTLHSGDAPVKYDAAANKANHTETEEAPTEPLPVWYCEQEHDLFPVYGYGLVDENSGGFIPVEVTETAEGLTFTSGEEPVTYTIQAKANGDFVYGTGSGDAFQKVGDIERYIKGYLLHADDDTFAFECVYGQKAGAEGVFDINTETVYPYDFTGESYTEGNEIRVHTQKRAQEEGTTVRYYYTERIDLYELWHAEGSSEAIDEVTEVYKNESGDEYSRYVSGVWYLLLGGESEDGTPVIRDNVSVLEMDKMVTDITGSMEDTMLARLWFHELLQSNPFVEFSFLKLIGEEEGIEMLSPVLDEDNQKIPYNAETYPEEEGYREVDGYVYKSKHVLNLVQVALGDMVALMQAINDKTTQYINSLQGLLGGLGG